MFADRLEAKLGNVSAAQERPTELRLVNEFLAALEWQRVTLWSLRQGNAASRDQKKERNEGFAETGQSAVIHPT